jgi:hypothetical protein
MMSDGMLMVAGQVGGGQCQSISSLELVLLVV